MVGKLFGPAPGTKAPSKKEVIDSLEESFFTELREIFAVWANGYFDKPGRSEEFSCTIKAFARADKIEGIRE